MFRCLIVICCISILIGGCTAPQQKDNQQLERAALKQFLQNYENAWNDHNINNFIELWHDDAKIMTGVKNIVSKEEYKNALPNRFRDYPSLNIVGSPDIMIKGNKATIKFYSTYPPIVTERTDEVLFLSKENNRWLIIENKY